MPAKAGIQNCLKTLVSRLRGNDVKGRFKPFYETINVGRSMFDVLSVRCSSFKTTPYGINVTFECLQNNLALMEVARSTMVVRTANVRHHHKNSRH